VISGLIPLITSALALATHSAWWHPGIILAALSIFTLVASIIAGRWKAPVDDAPLAVDEIIATDETPVDRVLASR
jgi:hypothetical protein